jgi:transcription elongation factor GreA
VPAPAAAALHDRAVILPYANLQAADGTRKAHAIAGSLLTDESAGPVTDAERRAAAGRAQTARAAGQPAGRAATGGRSDPTRNTGVLRSRSVLTASGRPAAPRSPRAAGAGTSASSRETGGAGRQTGVPTAAPTIGSKAPKAPTRLSEDGLAALRAELDELTNVTRPAIVARIAAARELGDLKENSDYHEARREQSFAEGRVRAIEELLRNVEIIEEGADGGRARLGSTVAVLGPDEEEETYTLVGSSEANAAAGRISAESPIGAALMNAAAGDEVEVIIPAGRLRYRVVEVR